MKLSGAINRPGRRSRRTLAGSILAEAAIGLFLLVFVWLLVCYVNYMCDKRIRTNMAARYSAWLSGNKVDPNANNGYTFIRTNFFMGKDGDLAVLATPVKNNINIFGLTLPSALSSVSPGLAP